MIDTLRETLGKAHYERMRSAMAPDLLIAPWAELSPETREAWRGCLDYVLPDLAAAVDGLMRRAAEDQYVELLDAEVLT